MFAGIALFLISSLSLLLCIMSLVRLNERLKRYALPQSTNTLMWEKVSIKHFAWLYTGLILYWFVAGIVVGIIIILK